MALTPKQEAFAQAVATGKTQADAYRAAFSASKMKPETIHKRASELMANGEVTGRVAELRKPVVMAVEITLESHLNQLAYLRDKAEQEGKFSAAVTAEVARGKASGLYVDKVSLTGANEGPILVGNVTPEQLEEAARSVRDKY